MPTPLHGQPLRVGIAGARGIGRHHATWFARLGCAVTAVYGTTPDSAAESAAKLRDLFGFSGRVFHDWDAFVAEGEFEAASICSPAELHLANACDLAAAGKHLLCEKPLVWNWEEPPGTLLADAAALGDCVRRSGVVFGMNAQYPAVLEGWTELYRRTRGTEPEFRSLYFRMETKGKPRSPHGAAEVWVDLAPHPLAVLDAVAPGAVDWTTLRHEDGPLETRVEFDWTSPGRDPLRVVIECRRTTDGSVCRQIGDGDLLARYGTRNVDGVFLTELTAGQDTWTGKDLMQVSIERFAEAARTGEAGRVLVGLDAALRQQEALVGVWERCWYPRFAAGREAATAHAA